LELFSPAYFDPTLLDIIESIRGYIEFCIATVAAHKVINRRTFARTDEPRKVIWKDLLEVHGCSIDLTLIAPWAGAVP
jgi:hypothetical protein